MSTATLAPFPPPDPAAERAERHGAMLRELAEIGMRVARALADRTEAEAAARAAGDDAAPSGDSELGFARLSRAVRLTMALERKVAEDEAARLARAALAGELAAMGRPAAAPDLGDGAEAEHKARVTARQERITEAIERSLEPEDYPDEHKRLLWEVDWAVDEAGDEPDFLDRPFAEAVARVRAALDLDPDPAVEGVMDDEDLRRAGSGWADGDGCAGGDAPAGDGFRLGP